MACAADATRSVDGGAGHPLFEGILMDGGLLSIGPVYFSITGGCERLLYRVARKHAGGAGEGGFIIPLPTLFEKSGAEGTSRRFKFETQAIVRRRPAGVFPRAHYRMRRAGTAHVSP
jgi:plasmid replication initiation protein